MRTETPKDCTKKPGIDRGMFHLIGNISRAGQIKGFTGIDQPYERPDNPEVVVDTVNVMRSFVINFNNLSSSR